ncbi:MAG: hypothetical protein ABFS42_11540 [Candidatus Krumholzibacteriota bacterium]
MRPLRGLFFIITIFVMGLSGCANEEPAVPVKADRVPQVMQLTGNHDVFEANPIYSPDGNWILFESDVTGNRDLWLIPATGGEPRQLTFDKGFDSAPFWSPDGKRIVFESERSGFKNIWIIDPDAPAADPVALTSGVWEDADPVWSPDGEWIAYESNRAKDGGTDLWMSPVAGGPAKRLTTTGAGVYIRTADWSPDGTRLVCESNLENASSALYVLAVEGGSLTRITPENGYEGHPAWSPDGEEIAYESAQSGIMEIHVIPAAGGAPFQVTTGGGFWPRWSPGGDYIVFCVFGDPEPNIWVVEVDW